MNIAQQQYIQRKWRTIMMREFNKAILRVTYKREWDPVRNAWKYVNRDDGTEMHHKPLTLRNDLWDVNEVADWSIGHVSLADTDRHACTNAA